ncbi:leucine-rich repeat domain-containing protein [Pandoraea sputorum]|uniref:hypothetical protein n=1 Tax=Pandoraea sputorum TaxID=93222 RepID=UPI00123FF311|nr:hypothetical protein [Pandoraea sputorum]
MHPNRFTVEIRPEHFHPAFTLAQHADLPVEGVQWHHVRFDLSGCAITEEHLNEMTKSLASLTYLTRLELNFSGCSSQLSIENMLIALQKAEHLQVLHIHLNNSGFLEKVHIPVRLGRVVSQLPKLKSFSLEASSNNFSNDELCRLFYRLSRAKKLENISIDLSGGKNITGITFKELSNAIKKSDSLKKLSFDISRINKINDIAIHHLCSVIEKSAIKLEELNVNIERTQCTDGSVMEMAHRLNDIKIQRLNICAVNVARLTPEAHQMIDHLRKNFGVQAHLFTQADPANFA